jgi:diguanylate cyclase (GGDEF)-like protein/PAS domain S-box-containing protein
MTGRVQAPTVVPAGGVADLGWCALEAAPEAVMVTEVRGCGGPRIVLVNAAFERITGWRREEVLGLPPRVLGGPRGDREVIRRLRADLAAGRTFRGQAPHRRRDGAPLLLRWSTAPVRDAAGAVTHHVSVMSEVPAPQGGHRAEAQTDALTGTADRRYFSTALEAALADPAAAGDVVLVSVDVDHLRGVNERHGHRAGDAVLREVARRIRAAVRDGDLVARTGGEEFSVLAVWTGDAHGLTRFAERIRRDVERAPVRHGRVAIPVTVSIGVARAGDVGPEVATLVAVSDRRLYRAKRLGRNRVVTA